MVMLCFVFARCSKPVKNEIRIDRLQSYRTEPGEIMKRDLLYDEGPIIDLRESKLLHNFIKNLPQKQREGLQSSLYELKRLRNKEL